MRRVALVSILLALATTTTSCTSDTAAEPAGTPTKAPSATSTEAEDAEAVGYDNTVQVAKIEVAPRVIESFSKADIANAKLFIERWVSDLTMRPEDIFKSGGGGYTTEAFSHLRPYVDDDFWDLVLDRLAGARRSAQATAGVKGAKHSKTDSSQFNDLNAIGGYGINTPGALLAKPGLINPKVSGIRVTGTEFPTAVKVEFNQSWYAAFDTTNAKLIRGLKKEKDAPEGTDGARIEFDRIVWIYRIAAGEPWRAYTWESVASDTEYVVLADALDS